MKKEILLKCLKMFGIVLLVVLALGGAALYYAVKQMGGWWYFVPPEDDNCTFVSEIKLQGPRDLYIEAEDRYPSQNTVIRFSKDGREYNDSIVFEKLKSGYAVLYFNASDTLYFDSTDFIRLLSHGQTDFHFEFGTEDYDLAEYSCGNPDLWDVGDKVWKVSGYPKLKPIAESERVYIQHSTKHLVGRKPRTLFLHMDSCGNLSVNPSL